MIMTVEFVPVTTDGELKNLASLADEIWHEYWPSLIGRDQTDYMVEKFQSFPRIAEDVRSGSYEYWLIRATADNRVVGYTGGREEQEEKRYFISKIYLLKAERGQGFASETLRFYENLCRMRGLQSLYLTVNKHNDLGVRTYRAKGFETIDSVETDIGEGYVMDDFIMEKQVDQDGEGDA